MTLEDYAIFTGEIGMYPTENDFGLCYTWLGLCGEYAEFRSQPSTREAGDVCWYISEIVRNINLIYPTAISLYEVFDTSEAPVPITTLELLAFNENIKKYYRDGKPVDTNELLRLLNGIVGEIWVFNSDIAGILQENYDKLTRRRNQNQLHGDGSDRELSL